MTLRRLATVSGYAASTMSIAESGRKLPSWDVVAAYVKACGAADVDLWHDRWRSAAETEQISDPEPPEIPAPTARPRSNWSVAGIAAVASAIVTAATCVVLIRPAPVPVATTSAESGIAVTSSQHVTDGIDPKAVGCTDDATALDSAPVVLHQTAVLNGRQLLAGTQVGSVLLLFSARCAGAWPRFEPVPA